MDTEKKVTKKQLVKDLINWAHPKDMARALSRIQDRMFQASDVISPRDKEDYEILAVIREFVEDLQDKEEEKRNKRQWDA